MNLQLPDVSQYTIVIWVAIGVVVLFGIAQATDKGLGPIGRWLYQFAAERRAAGAAKDDARVVDLLKDNDHLKRRVEELASANEGYLDAAATHSAWDWDVRQKLQQAQIEHDPPPPLRPRPPTTP